MINIYKRSVHEDRHLLLRAVGKKDVYMHFEQCFSVLFLKVSSSKLSVERSMNPFIIHIQDKSRNPVRYKKYSDQEILHNSF